MINCNKWLSYSFAQSNNRILFENLNVYFMNTAGVNYYDTGVLNKYVHK